MAASIVLLKYNFRYTVFGKCIEVRKKVILENVDIYITVACPIDKYNWTEFIAGKTSPYHLKNTSIPRFASDVFRSILLLLCLMPENPNLLLRRILLECTLIRPINFGPILPCFMLMFSGPLEMLYRMVLCQQFSLGHPPFSYMVFVKTSTNY